MLVDCELLVYPVYRWLAALSLLYLAAKLVPRFATACCKIAVGAPLLHSYGQVHRDRIGSTSIFAGLVAKEMSFRHYSYGVF